MGLGSALSLPPKTEVFHFPGKAEQTEQGEQTRGELPGQRRTSRLGRLASGPLYYLLHRNAALSLSHTIEMPHRCAISPCGGFALSEVYSFTASQIGNWCWCWTGADHKLTVTLKNKNKNKNTLNHTMFQALSWCFNVNILIFTTILCVSSCTNEAPEV